MRNTPNLRIEQYRICGPGFESPAGANFGAFRVGSCTVISSGTPSEDLPQWEHVSVSCRNRCPTWEEMAFIKNLFWREDETVIQFHPKKEKYVNAHPYCLHLWKQIGVDHELPPKELIA